MFSLIESRTPYTFSRSGLSLAAQKAALPLGVVAHRLDHEGVAHTVGDRRDAVKVFLGIQEIGVRRVAAVRVDRPAQERFVDLRTFLVPASTATQLQEAAQQGKAVRELLPQVEHHAEVVWVGGSEMRWRGAATTGNENKGGK